MLGQIFRRNYPSYSAGLSLNIPLRNRAAQSDYVTQALHLRQSELGLQKAVNQVRVDVQNAVIGLRQAQGALRFGRQGAYSAAADARCRPEEIHARAHPRFFRWSQTSRRWPPRKAPNSRRSPTIAMRAWLSIKIWAGRSRSITFRSTKRLPEKSRVSPRFPPIFRPPPTSGVPQPRQQ